MTRKEYIIKAEHIIKMQKYIQTLRKNNKGTNNKDNEQTSNK